MATMSLFSKRKTTRQLPETRTLHWPARVALQGMQPEAGRVGATGMRRLLQAEQDAPEPWHQMYGVLSAPREAAG